MNKEFTSGYAPVNGLNIYYEIHSVADERKTPLVLLHGGGDTIQTSFRYVLPALVRDRQIIAFEQQGVGAQRISRSGHLALSSPPRTRSHCSNISTSIAQTSWASATAARSPSMWQCGVRNSSAGSS